MKILGINDEKCIKCLACVNDCPASLFIKKETKPGEKRKVYFEDPTGNCCIKCGHCVCICPTDAIIYESDEKFETFEGVDEPSKLINYDSILQVLRSRRSIRKYKDKPVPKKDIEAVLEAMRYAPSATNAQIWKYIVVQDPKNIAILRKATQKMFKILLKALKFAKLFKIFLPSHLKEYVTDPSTKISLENLVNESKRGEDNVFYGAPVIIITYAPLKMSKTMIGVDAGIALTHGMLAAQSRGLGTCLIGFTEETLNHSKKLKKKFGISKKEIVNGVMILGYPAVKYNKVPPREKLKIKWS
ncbi:MAG: nitroreductase family protein [Promethearchaeia archaeon]